jgi:uncharacterized protein YndB with AHSA1/START domain
MSSVAAETIEVTTVVSADPESTFRYFTEEVDQWWMGGRRGRAAPSGNSRIELEPEVGGRLVEIFEPPDVGSFEFGRVLSWEPGRRLVLEFRFVAFQEGETTEVEVSFEPVARGTRVTIEHRGFEQLAADHPVRHELEGAAFQAMMGGWWADQLTAVAAGLRVSRA